LLNFGFGIRYGVSVRFRFGFFKYAFYSRVLVLLVFSCGKLKLLFSAGWYSTWGLFIGFSGIFRSLIGIGGILTSVEFNRIPGLVESGGFFRRRVDIGGNLRLIDFSGFPRF